MKPLCTPAFVGVFLNLKYFNVPTHNKGGSIMHDVSEDTGTLHRLFEENKEVMDWLKDK